MAFWPIRPFRHLEKRIPVRCSPNEADRWGNAKMAGLDQEVGLVGRDGVVELVEHLVERDSRRQLPVVVAYGPGGSGKTALLTHLERRYNANTPLAMVSLSQNSSKTPQDVLDAVFIRLCRDSQKQFGQLRLPRYEAARIIRACAAETVDAPSPHLVIRRRLAEQLTVHTITQVMGHSGEVSGGMAGFFGRLLRPLTRWMISKAVVAPQPLRWLLAGPKYASAFRWYERKAHKYLRGLAVGVHVDNVGAHIHGRINDEPANDATRDQLNAFMVAALLADLRAEYRWRRIRKVNCLMLLDNADLLSPDEAELWAVSRAHRRSPQGKDLLDLLADELREHPDTPLLVVATKQAAPAGDGFALDAYGTPGGTESDPKLEARRRYQRWARNQTPPTRSATPRPAAYLPVRLEPLTLDQTRQLLDELSELDEETMREETRVREIHEATHGHPQAIQLISTKLSLSSDKASTVPAVRAIFDELARPEESHAERGETVREHLLMRFLQRFRTESLPQDAMERAADASDSAVKAVRRETNDLLSKLAAPMWLDEATIELLADDRDADSLRRIKDYLPILSFVDMGEDGNWYLHPLLRDLLVNEMLATEAELDFSYDMVHRELALHYANDPWKAGSLLAMQYHLLALGEVEEVAKHFAERARRAHAGDDWQADLEQIATAPNVRGSSAGEIREWLTSRNLLWDAPRSLPFEQVIDALQALLSCTSRQRWDEGTLLELEGALNNAAQLPNTDVVELRSKYRGMGSGSRSIEVPKLRAVLRADGNFPYPRVLLPRHTIRRVVGAALTLALVGYGLVYWVHTTQHCDRGGFGSVESVRWVWDDTTILQNQNGQCIGIATGVGAFAAPPTEEPAEKEIEALSSMIAAENAEVERLKSTQNKPYVTVVVATILSSNEEPPRHGLAVGVNELRGAYLAQQEWNGFELGAGSKPFHVRLVLANLGGELAEASNVAPKIRELARQDPTVIAVTGLSQTRDTTLAAVQRLGPGALGEEDGEASAVPMVSSEASGDGLTGRHYFFRVAVPSIRQAEAGRDFLVERGDISQRKPFVLVDNNDPYSTELTDDYEKAFAEVPDLLAPPVRLNYSPNSADLRLRMDNNMSQMCDQSKKEGRKPLLIYTGRANEAYTMLAALSRNGSCAGETLVLGSDDMSQLDLTEQSYLNRLQGFNDDQLMFTSYSTTEEGWAQVGADVDAKRSAQRFFDAYRKVAPPVATSDGTPFETPANAHVMAGYDALGLVLEAGVRAGTPDYPVPDRARLFEALRGTTGEAAYPGASGKIDFGPASQDPRAGADPRGKLVSVNRIVDIQRDPQILFVKAYRTR
jgi:ABC-type branched-subunit amino acid transport system substrate-binding protein